MAPNAVKKLSHFRDATFAEFRCYGTFLPQLVLDAQNMKKPREFREKGLFQWQLFNGVAWHPSSIPGHYL